jgi:1-acyl-sn-glycerol-3-phosphate acyltransferase
MTQQPHQLTDACIEQMSYALGRPNSSWAKALIRLVFGRAALRFSELVIDIDRELGEGGMASGARRLLPRFVASHEASGAERIPSDGPLLIVANHPGSYDAVAIMAYVERPDLKFLVREVGLFRRLENLAQHAIFTPKGKNALRRIRPVRECVRHLENGGALLIFPRGRIEPDPDITPEAELEFEKWSRSVAMLTERVPETRVMVAITGGVIAPSAMRHPITWFRSSRGSRQRLAFLYQIFRQALAGKELFGLNARVTFGDVFVAPQRSDITAAVESSARQTLARHKDPISPPAPGAAIAEPALLR